MDTQSVAPFPSPPFGYSGHVCDYRCKSESGHHAWPSPPPRYEPKGNKRAELVEEVFTRAKYAAGVYAVLPPEQRKHHEHDLKVAVDRVLEHDAALGDPAKPPTTEEMYGPAQGPVTASDFVNAANHLRTLMHPLSMPPAPADPSLAERLAKVEWEVATLTARLDALESPQDRPSGERRYEACDGGGRCWHVREIATRLRYITSTHGWTTGDDYTRFYFLDIALAVCDALNRRTP